MPLHLAASDHATPGQIGTAFALPTLTFSLVAPLIGPLTSRVGRWPVMLGGIVVMGAVLPGLALVNGVLWTMGLLALLGIGLGCVLSPTLPALATLVEQSGKHAYGVVYAIYNTAYALGLFLGPLASGSFVQVFGFFLALVIISVVLGLFVALCLLVMGVSR